MLRESLLRQCSLLLHSYLAQAHSPDDLPHLEAGELEVQVHDFVKKSNACEMKVRFGVPFLSKPSFGVLSILWWGRRCLMHFERPPPFFLAFCCCQLARVLIYPGYVAVIINPQISEA